MRLGPRQDNPVTGRFIPIHENAAEIEATLAAVHNLIDVQAQFEFPEQKAFLLKLLGAARDSVFHLHFDGEIPEVLAALSVPSPPETPPEG
ncbi:MAG TPA: hypothetical protein VI457_12060 [Methylococcaceae bacterium]|nr:hypothetical protein [Methylococcaceae bacterium]